MTARLDPDEPDGYVLEDVVTFDPGPALRLLREHLPDARYAVEDIGVGFRMNELFPTASSTACTASSRSTSCGPAR